MHTLQTLTSLLAPSGLNHLGLADVHAWDAAVGPARQADALCPGATAIIVVANGGPTLWRAFLADLQADPRRLTEEENPFDAFVRRTVMAADARLGDLPRRWFWAAADAETHIDFRVLAQLAGIGEASRLGLLLDDTYGPWLGLRAACFVNAATPLRPSGTSPRERGEDDHAPLRPAGTSPRTRGEDEAPGVDGAPRLPPLSPHCTDCTLCVSACPGSAFPDQRWAVDACSTWHHVSDRCASTCHAREACPIGADQRYDPDEVVYHYNRARGRQALRDRLGLAPGADRFEGTGPHWADWRVRVDVAGG